MKWTKEGDSYSKGFNFYLCKTYFRIVYKNKNDILYYYRLRWIPSFYIFKMVGMPGDFTEFGRSYNWIKENQKCGS